MSPAPWRARGRRPRTQPMPDDGWRCGASGGGASSFLRGFSLLCLAWLADPAGATLAVPGNVSCPTNFTGPGCAPCIRNVYGGGCNTSCAASTSCNDNGRCKGSTGTCICYAGWAGPNCSEYTGHPQEPNECPDGFTGPDCQPCERDTYTGECSVQCSYEHSCSRHGRCKRARSRRRRHDPV